MKTILIHYVRMEVYDVPANIVEDGFINEDVECYILEHELKPRDPYRHDWEVVEVYDYDE